MAGKERHTEVQSLLGTVDQYADTDYCALELGYRSHNFSYGLAGGEHVIDNEDPFARANGKAASERPLLSFPFRKYASYSQLPGYLKSQDNTTGRRSGNYLDSLLPEMGRDLAAELLCIFGELQNAEFLPVAGGMQSRGELKMPLHQGSRLFEDFFYITCHSHPLGFWSRGPAQTVLKGYSVIGRAS